MKKENKYQIKCINYFADRDLIVYGNLCTPKRYIPITFTTEKKDFRFQIDIDKWEELYKNRGLVLKLIQQEYKNHKDCIITLKNEIKVDNKKVIEELKRNFM